MPGQHARLSPSDAARWLRCGLAIRLDDKYPEKEDELKVAEVLERWASGTLVLSSLGPALKGSISHAYVEFSLAKILGLPAPEDEVPIDLMMEIGFIENAEKYIEQILKLVDEQEYKDVELETRVELWYEPGSFGTLDFSAYSTARQTLDIVDYKSGTGRVRVVENPQLMIYGKARLEELELHHDIQFVRYGIMQPAILGGIQWGDPISREDIERFERQVDQQVAIINGPAPSPGNPGAVQCQWCRHKPTCPARLDQFQDLLGLAESGAPSEYSPETLSEAFAQSKLVLDWIKALEGYMKAHLDDFPAWKLAPPKVNKYVFKNKNTELVAKFLAKLGLKDVWKEPTLHAYSDLKKQATTLADAEMVLLELENTVEPEYAKTQRLVPATGPDSISDEDLEGLY